MTIASNRAGSTPIESAMSNELIDAADPASFARALAVIDTDVPLRSEGRTQQRAERYACVPLLATILPASWTYPLVLAHGDQPDFVLSDAQRRVGIEHTEVVPQALGRLS